MQRHWIVNGLTCATTTAGLEPLLTVAGIKKIVMARERGALNVTHDFNFVYPENAAKRVYWNPREVGNNNAGEDINGLVDALHGYNFDLDSPLLTTIRGASGMPALHGTMCAALICGTGAKNSPYEIPQALKY